MIEKRTLRVLVVDDEVAVQKLLLRALSQQGFECDTAADGNEAAKKASAAHYDAVVTDLKMPNKHGHALATHLLALEQRPVIVIHTCVVEPRLAKDLLARGVDDILFKPCDLSILAAKVKSLVERRLPACAQRNGLAKSGEVNTDDLHEQSFAGGRVTLPHLESKLSGLSGVLPISKAAFEVYNMTSTDRAETPQVAAAIQRDATLAAEILRLANSSFYNATGQRIVQLERAVVRIGQRRIGELALATNAFTALTSDMVPSLNVGLAWKRSMAAGLAIELLIDVGHYQRVEQGLLLSAIMHPLGRFALGALYPKQYEEMMERCQSKDESLLEQERQVFPISHAEVMSDLLATWNIPADAHTPLKYVLTDYSALRGLAEPTRLKAELVKLAIFIGEISVGQWETWDWLDLPPSTLLTRLGIASISDIIEQVKCDVGRLATFRTGRPEPTKQSSRRAPTRELAYCDLSAEPFDFLGEVVSTFGITLVKYPAAELNDLGQNLLVNCIRTAPERLEATTERTPSQHLLIVTDGERTEEYSEYGRAIAVPTTYSQLRSVCWEASLAVRQTEELVGSTFSKCV